VSSFLIIDGRNAIFRHAAVNQHLSRQDGFPTGAIYGCLNSLLSLHKLLPDAGIVWVWDGRGETWRHKFMQQFPQLDSKEFPESDEEVELEDYAKKMVNDSINYLGLAHTVTSWKTKKEKKRGYKANRYHPENEKKKGKQPKYPETPRERALLQIPVLKLILERCGIRNYEVDELEGDDLLAMIAKKIMKLDNEAQIYIHSGDKDYYQLLAYKQCQIVKRVQDGKLLKVKAEDVLEEYGVKPKHWAKYEALTGGHNNVAHLRNIGSVRAKEMLEDGIDPSKQECPEIDERWHKYFPMGVTTMWPSVNGNYKLCRLVDDPKDELLSKEVRAKLAPLFSHFDNVKRFYRSSKGKTPDAYRKVSFVLAQYELNSILARRQQLWDIP
jgi:5'-3' exonuclease